ncbi:MAG TPA: N-(5'-phosphoribosyl)anthranilate isomerase, partial [Lachnospiraceae bacterium]|nr:N-(5'-phosphoribosyl)anthranilate isomerase [Lachnospiraceae bacterium]
MSVTKIKICGLRSEEDIRIVNRCQPDYAGFICCSRFRRYVPSDTLEQLSKLLHPGIRKVGVFVDQPVEQIA